MSKFKHGDKVIIRRPQNPEDLIGYPGWISHMDYLDGTTTTISSIRSIEDLYGFPLEKLRDDDDYDGFCYKVLSNNFLHREEWLELVEVEESKVDLEILANIEFEWDVI